MINLAYICKKMAVLQWYKEKGRGWESECFDELDIDYKLGFELIQELVKEGRLRRVEDDE